MNVLNNHFQYTQEKPNTTCRMDLEQTNKKHRTVIKLTDSDELRNEYFFSYVYRMATYYYFKYERTF